MILESGGSAGAAATPNSDATSAASASATASAASAMGDGTQVVFTDELMPTECLVKLETQAPAGCKVNPLFAVHAIEGFVTALKPLAAKLTVPMYGLQCTKEAPLTSLSDLAAFYIKQIKTVQKTGPYVIIGYSFGASVAFEMVSSLEKAGEKAALVMLDGSPKYVSWYTEAHQQRQEGGATESQNEAFGLAYFGLVVANLDYVKTAKELDSLASFELKLKRIADLISQKSKFSSETAQLAASTFFKKLKAAHNYKPERKLTTSIVTLFKPTENYVKLSADYGLSEVGFILEQFFFLFNIAFSFSNFENLDFLISIEFLPNRWFPAKWTLLQ